MSVTDIYVGEISIPINHHDECYFCVQGESLCRDHGLIEKEVSLWLATPEERRGMFLSWTQAFCEHHQVAWAAALMKADS